VDVSLDEPRYDKRFSGDDPKKGCIVDKLMEFGNVLGDPARPVEERRVALRFVVHLVGDLHQPLHVGDNHDRGGNDTQVRWFNRGSNMHRVWDSDIIDHVNRTPDGWLADLVAMDTPEARGKAMAGLVEDWATESLLAARQAYQDPATGMRIKPGTKLADSYQVANLPVVRRRLYQGGVRSAMVLDEASPEMRRTRVPGSRGGLGPFSRRALRATARWTW
jgi:nuclease S1